MISRDKKDAVEAQERYAHDMEERGKKDCFYAGETYAHGLDICVEHNLMRCDDGEWEYEIQEHGQAC